MPPTNLLTAAEAAALRGVSKRRILKLIEEGRLKAEKVGQQFVIKPADLKRLEIRPTAGRPPADAKPAKAKGKTR